MARVILVVMDSFGCGGAPDAGQFGDDGADTFGHIADACLVGNADIANVRQGPLHLPFLIEHGLGNAAELASGAYPTGMPNPRQIDGQWGIAIEQSAGKDTPSGHWEICGQPVFEAWHTFANQSPSFPDSIIDPMLKEFGLAGVLGNKHASGTDIIEELGDEHLRTGMPIVYTSVDSVFQIAAHERTFGLDRLYAICEYMRKALDIHNVGRVIARPFTGESADQYKRTSNRRDYSVPPPEPTLLDILAAQNRHVISIGKIADIFAHRATGDVVKAGDNDSIFEATLAAVDTLDDGGLLFSNFVDFDSVYGHRRNVAGYAESLERFDSRLPELKARLKPADRIIITADHGCDPTWPGTDHTREAVPVLAFGADMKISSENEQIGRRDSFADIGQSIASYLGVDPLRHGTKWSLH